MLLVKVPISIDLLPQANGETMELAVPISALRAVAFCILCMSACNLIAA